MKERVLIFFSLIMLAGLLFIPVRQVVAAEDAGYDTDGERFHGGGVNAGYDVNGGRDGSGERFRGNGVNAGYDRDGERFHGRGVYVGYDGDGGRDGVVVRQDQPTGQGDYSTVPSTTAEAPSGSSYRPPYQEQQNPEEFQTAERVAQNKQDNGQAFQQQLERLTSRRAAVQAQVVMAQARLKAANDQLQLNFKSGDQTAVERYTREVAEASDHLKTAQAQADAIEAELQSKIRAFQQSLQDEYDNVILPGESLEVYVTEDDTLNGLYQVRRGGYIIMPRVGRIYVAGKDLPGVEKAIKEALQVTQIKDAEVVVDRAVGNGSAEGGPVIFLAGEFMRPGAWKIPPGVSPTVVTTILRSGGTTLAADLTKVKVLSLVNGHSLVEEVDVQSILNGADLTTDVVLNPGDIVMVPPFANVVYVTGNVAHPGTMRLLPDAELTAYSAILRAGGFSRFANRKRVYVLRDMGEDTPRQRIPVNVKDVQTGALADVVLQSKDIVVVPEKFFSW